MKYGFLELKQLMSCFLHSQKVSFLFFFFFEFHHHTASSERSEREDFCFGNSRSCDPEEVWFKLAIIQSGSKDLSSHVNSYETMEFFNDSIIRNHRWTNHPVIILEHERGANQLSINLWKMDGIAPRFLRIGGQFTSVTSVHRKPYERE